MNELKILQPLVSILAQTEACIVADDPLGLRSGLLLFVNLIESNGEDTSFYETFLLSHLVPFCVLAPTRPSFRIADAQFGLALNEIGNCLFSLAQKQVCLSLQAHHSSFLDFLLPFFEIAFTRNPLATVFIFTSVQVCAIRLMHECSEESMPIYTRAHYAEGGACNRGAKI